MPKLSPNFSSRLKAAKEWRAEAEPVIKDVLSFVAPGRENDFNRKGSKTEYDTCRCFSAEDYAKDFAGDLAQYYTPSEGKWIEFEVEGDFGDNADEVEAQVNEREDAILDALTKSNFYDVAPQWWFEFAHGTAGIWVEKAHLMQPIYFEPVLPHQLYLTPGHLGILDRFREVTNVPCSTLEALFQGWDVDLSDQSLRNKMSKEGTFCTVMWGFWVNWKDPGNPKWDCQIAVDNKAISEVMTIGPLTGGCPLNVGRFNPQIGRPWGRGPGWTSLPDMLMLDKMDEIMLSGADQSLLNTLIYADDGFIDFEGGIVAGSAIPAGRGFTRESVYQLQNNNNFQQGWVIRSEIENRIRTSYYQDGPRQRGDTPPTRAQWVDERRRVQQRLGKPSAPIWTEMLVPTIQRVEYLLMQQGFLPDAITHNEQAVNLQPISPLQKAANQEKVAVTEGNMGMIANTVGPEGLARVLDLPATLTNIIRASGDELIVVRKNDAAPTAPAVAPPAV